MTIKATRIEIKRLEDKSQEKERRAVWRSLGESCQVATNCFWQTWWDWHMANGSQEAVRQWRAELLAWHAANDEYAKQLKQWKEADKKTRGKKPEKTVGPKPKIPVQAMPKECSNVIYHKVANDQCTDLHTRTVVTLLQRLTKRMKSQKSIHGSLPWWCNLLLYREAIPRSIDPQPIPFDKRNAGFVEPAGESKNWRFAFTLERRGKGVTVKDNVELWTAGKKKRSVATIVKRIYDGEYKMLGSVLTTNRRGKWFVNITYEMPEQEKPQLDANREAVLWPGLQDPWLLKIADGVFWRGGTGRHIAGVRKRCTMERRERQESYRWAAGNQRGHGRKRATGAWTRLRNIWTNVCTNYNRHVAKAIVEECVRRGYGSLVYLQPEGKQSEKRFLSRAGKQPEKRESTSYPYYQMAQRLSQLCQEHGVEFRVKKCGGKGGEAAVSDDGDVPAVRQAN